MTPWLRPLHPEDALYIAEHLRPADHEEIVASMGPDYVLEIVRRTLQPGLVYAAGAERPIAMVGAQPWKSDTHWCASMLATEEWPRVAALVSKFVVRRLIPALDKAGVRKVECFSIEGHVEAHRWLRWLGAKPGGTRPSPGLNGEKFIRFAWERADVRNEGSKRQQRRNRCAAGAGAAGASPGGPG